MSMLELSSQKTMSATVETKDYMLLSNSAFNSELDFSLVGVFAEKPRSLGTLHLVKATEQDVRPLLARIINFKNVNPSITEQIILEAHALKALNSKYALSIEGMIFNKVTSVMHIFYPQKVSLFEYLHESGARLSAEDKYQICVNLAKAMDSLHSKHTPPAHTHLSSKNVMLNPSDLHI